MEDETCPHDPADMSNLRAWAWSRGRTDVILDLDLHDCAWAFQAAPSRANLVRLAAVMPAGTFSAPPELDIRQLVAHGCGLPELAVAQQSLRAWGARLCLAIAADLSESFADVHGSEPVEWG